MGSGGGRGGIPDPAVPFDLPVEDHRRDDLPDLVRCRQVGQAQEYGQADLWVFVGEQTKDAERLDAL